MGFELDLRSENQGPSLKKSDSGSGRTKPPMNRSKYTPRTFCISGCPAMALHSQQHQGFLVSFILEKGTLHFFIFIISLGYFKKIICKHNWYIYRTYIDLLTHNSYGITLIDASLYVRKSRDTIGNIGNTHYTTLHLDLF